MANKTLPIKVQNHGELLDATLGQLSRADSAPVNHPVNIKRAGTKKANTTSINPTMIRRLFRG